MSNTKTIARNTGWYGLENAVSQILQVFTSIAIARTLGPTKMGYIIYVTWIANTIASVGGLGIPVTTRKYMAEFLGMGDRGTARFVFIRTLTLQAVLATFATAGLVLWILHDATPEYRVACILIVVSIWFSMVNSPISLANVASEELSRNMPASVISIGVYFLMILSTVIFGWGVTGVGASMLVMRMTDFTIRAVPTMSRILGWEKTHVQPPGLEKRMMTFAWQSVASMIVAIIVWDRSEFILLKHLCSDIRQVAYYSIAFSMAEWLIMSATIFASAAGASVFAQYGRDKSRVPDMTASTFRYIALTSVPMHFVAAALSAPALVLIYGKAYAGAAIVVTLSPLMCLPKAFSLPIQSLLQAYEKQSYIVGATIFAGVLDMAVAWYLIPHYGAVGACIGSGVAQFTCIGLMWAISIYVYKVKLPWVFFGQITFISVLASLAAHSIVVLLSPKWGIIPGGCAALIVFFALLYLMRVLKQEDRNRLHTITAVLPKPFAAPVNKVLSILVRPVLVREASL